MSAAIALSTAFPLFSHISETVTKGDQDVNYQLLAVLDGNKVRVSIRSNPYAFQCHARVEVWSKTDMRWNLVDHRLPGAIATPIKLYYSKDWNRVEHFREDCSYLLTQAAAIII